MLNENVSRMFCFEFPNESWVPQFARHSQVFATSHHRIRLAAFRRRRNAIFAEIVLFASSDRYKSIRPLATNIGKQEYYSNTDRP
jgi:hypothetical protein